MASKWTTIQVKKELNVPARARVLAKLIERDMPIGSRCSIGTAVSVAIDEVLETRKKK